MVSGSKAIMLQQRPQHPTVTAISALSLAMHYILGSLVKGSWIAPHPHHQLDFPHYLPPHSPTQKSAICNKQRILYIQFSALVKMVSGSKAIMLQQRPQHPTVTATPHYPLPCTIFLAPLSKGAGLRQGYFLL